MTGTKVIPPFTGLPPAVIPWARAITEAVTEGRTTALRAVDTAQNLQSQQSGVFSALGTQAAEIQEVNNATAGAISTLSVQTETLTQGQLDQQNQIDSVADNVVEVGAIASDASSVANDAATAATAAQTTANDTAAVVEPLAQTYRFTSSGAPVISAPGSPYEFKIENTGAAILYNGEDVSTWTADEMWVKQFRGDVVKLGEHQIETYPGGGTVVRAIG